MEAFADLKVAGDDLLEGPGISCSFGSYTKSWSKNTSPMSSPLGVWTDLHSLVTWMAPSLQWCHPSTNPHGTHDVKHSHDMELMPPKTKTPSSTTPTDWPPSLRRIVVTDEALGVASLLQEEGRLARARRHVQRSSPVSVQAIHLRFSSTGTGPRGHRRTKERHAPSRKGPTRAENSRRKCRIGTWKR